ncbi:deoxyribose-phosphate aldolase [Clostridium botulinum C]|uniref:Deoxyribose-phosphate aldolase n=4 Tax=Clostridium TaxID=1485 RepID=A0A9Q4TNJ9_CLOBO|nr:MULTISPECIES: deoxyribose-phosphate aldolase [Clostridium]EGO88615.1 deoxyribose-phosphate aldolase [Clostridium botulinum C str. Stockholm]MCD3193697.1 deoxyribose-phosphate aldolase [Clostridium botulinum C]KEI06402.1 deoxyribose-phosphate aldolase [Clostridium sp. K25]KEI12451.1 deoxyribose-phosphate aldolase [Clostridium novyi B str. ATCC 27606]KEI15294.1 deoxyribose-phosphate aldolase [Clostridium novyi B str. NCTC 9691]
MKLNKYIDHTLLKPQATETDIKKICEEAKKYDFASVCVNTCYTSLVSKELEGTDVTTCVVIGFPLGATTTETKVFETKQAIEQGAGEVDMVINVGALKAKKYDYVKNDIQSVVEAAKGKALVKVILENCLLEKEEIVKACELSKEAGADFVKTSTGFSTGGATVEDVKLMRETVGPDMGVKASGAVRTKEDAEAVIAAGANRIGASASIAIVEGTKSENAGY